MGKGKSRRAAEKKMNLQKADFKLRKLERSSHRLRSAEELAVTERDYIKMAQ